MPSRSSLYTVLVTLCAVGLIAAAAAVHDQVPPVADTGYVAAQTPPEAAVPAVTKRAERLIDADRERGNRAVRAAAGKKKPFLNRSSGSATAVLPGPGRYRLRDLPPKAFVRRPSGIELRLPLVVAPGARLVIAQRKLLLRSTEKVRANVTVIDATLRVRGTRIRSVGPDTDPRDGRAYVLALGARMTMRGVHVSHLGFGTGRTSGVAWVHNFGIPSTGGAVDSTFRRNLFGVYSSGAAGLRFVRDRFVYNDVYGFDPHGSPPGMGNAPELGSNDFLVRDSLAAYNGRHGFIFSSGCNDNRVLDSISHHNGGSGFVIDDGKPRSGLVRPSNNNVLRGIEARDNAGVGVVIEGGTANEVQSALLVNNAFGLRITDGTRDTVVADTDIQSTQWTALAISDRARAQVDGVRIDGATVGVDSDGGARLHDVAVNDAAVAGLRMQPTDVVIGVQVSGVGRRAVDGIQQVQTSEWGSDNAASDGLTETLSSLRHQVWLLLLIPPVVLWSIARVLQRTRNLSTRTGL